MMSSRGMGAIKSSKMPKAKTITRKDNPNKVKMFAAGDSTSKEEAAKQAAYEKEMSPLREQQKRDQEREKIIQNAVKQGVKFDEQGRVKMAAGGKAKAKPVKKYSIGSMIDDMSSKGMFGVAPMEVNKVPEKRKAPEEDKGNFVEWKDRTDKSQYGLKKGGWIKDAIKKPGALRKSLGVKEGQKIPAKKLAAAAKAPGKLGQRARLAQTLSKMR